MERIEAEAMLEKNGDFLVRESKKKQGQYVLTALAVDKPQHLLLVDSAGKVRTHPTRGRGGGVAMVLVCSTPR